MLNAKKVFGFRVHYCEFSYDALKDADALAVVTEWNEFRRPYLQAHEIANENMLFLTGGTFTIQKR